MNSVYELSWSKTSFLAKLQLFFKSRQSEKQKIRSDDPWIRAHGYSSLSSTYYSIVGTGFAKIKATFRPKWLIWLAPVRILMWCLTWLPLSAWCYWRMLPLSNHVAELIGYDQMSADQCDVRQNILRRRGQYEEARRCIITALAKNPEKAHTRGLLRIGLAEIYKREGYSRNAETEVLEALVEASVAEKQDPRQAARIYRHCAEMTDVIQQKDSALANRLRLKAQELAKDVGSKDQLLKMSRIR